MKKLLSLMICLFYCLNAGLKADQVTDDLVKIFIHASGNFDWKLTGETVNEILKDNHIVLDALIKYSDHGKIDQSLHNAIKDKNLLSCIIFGYYTNNINLLDGSGQTINFKKRDAKSPLEQAMYVDMKEIIPYLLMWGANLYHVRYLSFFFEDDENLDHLKELTGQYPPKDTYANKIFFDTPGYGRTVIAEAIIKNRIDLLEVFEKVKADWNKPCFCYQTYSYTPLQLAIGLKRYEIGQYLLNHGAKIE